MRTIIEVPDDLIRELDLVGGLERRSRAAMIREAISEYVRVKSTSSAEAAFGVWKLSDKDGLAYQDRLRNEWDRE